MTRANWARLLLLAGIWGSSFLLIKLAVAGLSPAQVVLWRMTSGALVLLVIAGLRREPLPRRGVLLVHMAFMGVLANLIPYFLFAWGELRVTSGMAGILNGTTPLFTLAVATVALREERLNAARVGGFLLGFAGVVLVVAPWESGGANTVSGQLACLGAAACYGVGFVYTRRFIANRGFPPLALSAMQLTQASLLLWLLSPVVADDPLRLTTSVVVAVTVLGAVGTGLAYLLFYRLVADAGATSASMVTYLIPIVAVVLGIVFLDEPVGWNLFVGAGVVVAGVALAEGRLHAPSVDEPLVSETVR